MQQRVAGNHLGGGIARAMTCTEIAKWSIAYTGHGGEKNGVIDQMGTNSEHCDLNLKRPAILLQNDIYKLP